jgi:HEAT repeat protein
MGTDRAVDFLAQVARDSSEDELRRDAVIYLGTIGGPKARNALYEILRSP